MILGRMSGRGEWLPWRRDWTKKPDLWKVYVAYAVVAALLGCFYLAAGNLLFGFLWLVLAVFWVFVTRYVRRKSRLGPQLRHGDHQPD